MEVDGRWYIESWAVFDGIAFASQRAANGEVLHAVYLAPPYWSPVAVANIGTAYAAGRLTFQTGFFDADGREIPFDSLAEIREVLRRTYVASGYGFEPPSGGLDLGEVPMPAPGGGGEGSEAEEWHEVQHLFAVGQTSEDRHRLQKLLTRMHVDLAADREATRSVIRSLGMLSQRLMAAASSSPDAKIISADVAMLFTSVLAVFGGYSVEREWRDAFRGLYYRPLLRQGSTAATLPMIFRLPVARRGGHLETLGDLLCLASSSRNFLRSLRSPRDFYPVYLAALLICAGSQPTFWWRDDSPLHLVQDACAWIAANVPSVISEKHPAASTVERFIDDIRQAGWEATRTKRAVAVATA